MSRRPRSNYWDADVYETQNLPRASVYRLATHNVASGGGGVPIQWDSVDYDTDAMWNAAGGATITPRLTCRTSGVYSVNASAVWPAGTTSFRQISIAKNSATIYADSYQWPTASVISVLGASASAQVFMLAGDYVELWLAQNTGANITLPSNPRWQAMQVCLLSSL